MLQSSEALTAPANRCRCVHYESTPANSGYWQSATRWSSIAYETFCWFVKKSKQTPDVLEE